LAVVGAEFRRQWHVDDLLWGIIEEMDTLLKGRLGEEGWVVLVIRFALCLSHVVAERGTWARLEEGDHALAEEAVGVAHVEEFAVLALGEDTEVDRGYVLIPCVDDRGAVLHELKEGELLEEFLAEFVFDLLFGPLALLLNVEATEVNMVLCLPSSKAGET
jgi:hypothetical protein